MPFSRLIQELLSEYREGFDMEASALRTVQEAGELFLMELMRDAQNAAIHANRVTVQAEDIQFVISCLVILGRW